jgi:hypothetical protein
MADLAKLSVDELRAAFRELDQAHSAYAQNPGAFPEHAGRDEREVRAVLLGWMREVAVELDRRRLAPESASAP